MSRLILPFDTESTGIPLWKEPSESPDQPHLVQVGAILVDEYTKEVVSQMDVIVRPDGWDIPQETIDIHGITTEQAMDEGISEEVAVCMFMDLYDQCELRVAHNTTFDNRMIRIALKRYQPDRVSDEEWKDRDRYYCTFMQSKKIMGGNAGHTLPECLKHFTGREFADEHHSALPDARACLDIYFAHMAHNGEGHAA